MSKKSTKSNKESASVKKTTEKILENIKNDYMEVNDWKKLTVDAYVRYQKKDGTIPKGGFIKEILYANSDDSSTIKLLLISSKYDSRPFTWVITQQNVRQLWVKDGTLSEQKDEYNKKDLEEKENELNDIKSALEKVQAQSSVYLTYIQKINTIIGNLHSKFDSFSNDLKILQDDNTHLKKEILRLSNENIRIATEFRKYKLSR